MRTRHPLFVSLAAAAILSCLAAEGAWHVAAARATIHLLSGAAGTPCAPDPGVLFTSTSVLSPQPAVVGTGAPGNPCAVEDDLNQPGKSRCITTTNSSDVSAAFTVTFSLPALYGGPALDLLLKVDDYGQIYLNNHLIQPNFFCKQSQFVYSVHYDVPTYFIAGTNTLTFSIANDPNCSTPTPRSGPDDGMNLQFEGTVTYEPPPAGGGINLGWDDCGGLPPSLNQSFACNTNTGTHTLVGSFLAPCCITAMSANEVVMDLESTGATLPAWWQMRSGQCRPTSLSQSADFTGGPFTCLDYWSGMASGGITEDPFVGNRVRIKVLEAVPAGSPAITGILEGTETYSFKCNINSAKSTGLGACAGCATGVCIVLQSIKLDQPVTAPGGNKFVSAPATRAYATWQGGIGSDCYAATPAKNVTWGSIKAQYR